jgi:hypothetical protein
VKFCVIAAASPWGDCNDYMVEALRTRPLWRGTAILDPSTTRHELEALAREGFVGVRLPFISMKELPDLSSFDYRKFLYRLADMDWHVHLHLDGPRIPQVLPHLERSGVKIVIDHIGRPDPVLRERCAGFEAVTRSVEKGRTWVKLSGGYRLGDHAAELARELCRRVGYGRMLWASDCPFVGVESTTYAEHHRVARRGRARCGDAPRAGAQRHRPVLPQPARRRVIVTDAQVHVWEAHRPAARGLPKASREPGVFVAVPGARPHRAEPIGAKRWSP